MLIGLTGLIGSGKSEAAQIFASLGAGVISADDIAHDLVLHTGKAYKSIIQTWGKKIQNSDGTINRKQLGKIVFSNESEMNKLNKIMHPLIHEEFLKKKDELYIKGYKTILYDAPILIELGLHKIMDIVIVIYSSHEIILERLKKRGLDENDIELRLKSQLPLDEKLKYANYTIENNGTLEELKEKVYKIWEKLSPK